MKIAVTSQGPDLAGEVGLQFRGARFFIVVDTGTGEYSKYKNTQNHKDFLFAGSQVLQEILVLGVDAIITGFRAFLTFQTGSVEVYYGALGSVKEAIDQFKSKQLAFIFFLLKAKCPVIARGLDCPVGRLVLRRSAYAVAAGSLKDDFSGTNDKRPGDKENRTFTEWNFDRR